MFDGPDGVVVGFVEGAMEEGFEVTIMVGFVEGAMEEGFEVTGAFVGLACGNFVLLNVG